MKNKALLCAALSALAALTLAGCGGAQEGIKISGGSMDISDPALRPDGEGAQIYEHNGIKLPVPLEYNDLVTVVTDREDVLFSVSETASIRAAEALGEETQGAGWLFSISAVSEDELNEMLCGDLLSSEVFAKGPDGACYLLHRPSDVTLVRENYEAMGDQNSEDFRSWSALNQWAENVKDTFLTENGLAPESRGNSEVEQYLYRAAYLDSVSYTISAPDADALPPDGVEAEPYVARLTRGVTYSYSDDAVPEGGAVVLTFPDTGLRFDFFLSDGNYVREVWNDTYETLYQADFADGETRVGDVMSEWYEALAAHGAGA